jgi:hypothetical protein
MTSIAVALSNCASPPPPMPAAVRKAPLSVMDWLENWLALLTRIPEIDSYQQSHINDHHIAAHYTE